MHSKFQPGDIYIYILCICMCVCFLPGNTFIILYKNIDFESERNKLRKINDTFPCYLGVYAGNTLQYDT